MSSSDKQNTQNEKTMTTKKTKAMPRSCGNTKNKRKNDAATTKSSNKKLVGDNGNKTSSKSADETRNENTTASAEENAQPVIDVQRAAFVIPEGMSESEISSVTNSTNMPHNKSYHDLCNLIKTQECTIQQLRQERNGIEPMMFIDSEEQMVIRETKVKLFPKVQFVRNSRTLDDCTSEHSIGKFIMNRLRIAESQQRSFWSTYKTAVRKGIKMQRNVVHNALKVQFFGMYR